MFRNLLHASILINIFFVTTALTQVKLISGQPELFIPVADITTKTGYAYSTVLHYNGEGIYFSLAKGNDDAPVSWCGLGWELNIPSINVIHKNTVTMDDDQWFYHDANGLTDEIIRVYSDNTERFYLKHKPYVKITPHYHLFEDGILKVIDGWEMIDKMGVVNRFGDMGRTPAVSTESASRTIPCWRSKLIGSAPSGSTPLKFDYQWDLSEIEDTKGGKISFFYQQFNRTVDGYSYCGESYIKTIRSDKRQELQFELVDKSINERRPLTEFIHGDFDFDQTKLLSKLKKVDIARTEETVFSFLHNHAPQGFQKPILAGLESVKNNNNNFRFGYLPSDGLLSNVVNTKTGKTTTYTYSLNDIHLRQLDTFNIALQTSHFNNTTSYNMGNHIYCIDTGNGSVTRFEIIDYTGNRFEKAYIPGITGVDLQNTRCYPGSDKFVLVTAIKNGNDTTSNEAKVYEYIDKRWVSSSGFGNSGTKIFPIQHKTVAYPFAGNIIINDPISTNGLNYVFKKINGTWVSILNGEVRFSDPDGNGLKFPNVNTMPTEHGSIFHLRSTTIPDHYGQQIVWRWTGNSWDIDNILPAQGITQTSDTYRSSFYNENSFVSYIFGTLKLWRLNIVGSVVGYNSNINVVTIADLLYQRGNDWGSLTYTGPNGLPSGTKCYIAKNYFVTIGPDKWMMIGRYKTTDNGTFQPSLIARVNASDGIDPTASDGIHKWGYDTPQQYSKVFDYPIDTVYCHDDYFVALNRANNFVWVFRWNNEINKWESKINGQYHCVVVTSEWDDTAANWKYTTDDKCSDIPVKDSKGQGFKFNGQIKDIFLTNEKIGIWYYDRNTNDTLLATSISYGFGTTVKMDFQIRYPHEQQKKKIQLSDDALYELCEGRGSNGTQTLRIISNLIGPGRELFTYPASTFVVSSVTEKSGTGANIVTEYSYAEDLELDAFKKEEGIPYFRKVTTKVQNANNGSITNTFECDSLNGLFGVLLEQEIKANNNRVVSSTRKFWDVYTLNLPNQRIVTIPMLGKEERENNNVISATIWPADHFLGDITTGNGEPELSYTFNSNDHALVKKTLFAYNRNAADLRMKDKNMLQQVAGEVLYDVANMTKNWKSEVQRLVTTQQAINLAFSDLELNTQDQIRCFFNVKKNGSVAIVNVALRLNYQNGNSSIVESKNVYVLHLKSVQLSHTLVSSDNASTISSIDLLITPTINSVLISNIDADIFKDPDNDNNVIAGNATHWDFINSKWLPKSSYNWVVPMGSNGRPIAGYTFNPFNYQNVSNNVNWQQQDTIIQYNNAGSAIEMVKNKTLRTAIIYRNDLNIPIGNIYRGSFPESGVFTGDYDDNEDGFFDKENGWGKGAGNEATPPLPGTAESRVCEEAKHFGNKGVKVTNAFGPTRAFKLEKRRDYIFSAWIKKVAGNVPLQNGMVIGIDYRKRKSAEGVWPLDLYLATEITPISCNSTLKVVPHGDWYYIELPVNAKTDIPADKWNAGFQYGAAWVGVPNGNGSHGDATVYIDDIRFYPKDALVTSTYYNDTLGLPIVTVDANNNPGRKITYDGFGRPKKWEKLDLTKSTDAAGYATPVMKKEYHLMGLKSTPVYTNDYETGNVDFNTGDCGGNAVILSNGYNSSHCLKVENRITCYQTLFMNTSLFDKKSYVLKGYYKADQELKIEIRYTNATENNCLSEQVLPVTSDWTEFSLYFDLSGVTWPLTGIRADFYGRTDGDFPAYNLYLDDLNVGYLD